MIAQKTTIKIIPGTRLAMKRSAIDTSVMIPKRIRLRLGGIK
jgi:hypothetical protein